mmetsp:Transcript_116130/g.335394  ORF Transcript_116130/g.335394 Transcript_116130/m.335394 type:complete len:225 (-) Transcript_116130:132-806(-)
MASSGALLSRGPDGVPLRSDYDAMCPEPKSLFKLYTGMFIVFAGFGVGAGLVLWNFAPSHKASDKVSLLADYELGAIYIGVFFLKYMFQMISANMGTARRACKVNVPDQQVYRVYGGGPADGALVMMETEGKFGEFNRAQRALANLEEYLPIFLTEVLLVGFIYPVLVCALTVIFGCARLKGAFGYTRGAKERMVGNMIGFLMNGLLDGLVVFIGVVAIRKQLA